MSECNGCGGCCNPVMLPYSQLDIATARPPWRMDPADRAFILNDLTPVSRREGLRRHPWLRGARTVGLVLGKPVVIASFFYDCRHFDAESKRCTNYENRPPLCRDYPWYGERPDAAKSLPPECSYLEDIAVAVRVRVRAEIDAGTYYSIEDL